MRMATPCMTATQLRVPVLATQILTEMVLRGVVDAIGVLRSVVGVTAPLALSASLVGMENVLFATRKWYTDAERIERAEVFTPWATAEADGSAVAAVRSVADVIWQSAGIASAPNRPE